MKLILGLILFSVLFGIIERFFGNPDVPNKKDREDLKTDLIYWFVTPLFFKPFTALCIKILLFLFVVVIGQQDIKHLAENGWGIIPTLPLGVQVVLMMLTGDFFQYWVHRFFHTGRF
jgi:sterol desaturase/sphingolipid hydroxylase (fatty acid hydroxylase superfamily)